MKALIVYDSVYGNTEKIARAIGSTLAGQIKVLRANEVSPSDLQSLDILIVGSPTQGFRPTKSVQTFVNNIPDGALKGVKLLAFDTRFSAAESGKALGLLVKMGGYAAPRIAKALEKKGGNLAADPQGFVVKGREGPLKEGEEERAIVFTKKILSANLKEV
jgi:flavodoxin